MKRWTAAELVGTLCVVCDQIIKPGEITVDGRGENRSGYHRGRTWGHTFFFHTPGGKPIGRRPPGGAAAVHKSDGADDVDGELARPRLSTTAPRSRRGRGRPEVFIAALVVARAAALYAEHRRWSDVLRLLEQEGNGTYPRNTLIRRVAKYSTVQNPRRGPRRRAAAGAPSPVSTKAAGGRRRRRG